MPTEKERLATLENQSETAEKQIASLFRIVSGHNGEPGLNGKVTAMKEDVETLEKNQTWSTRQFIALLATALIAIAVNWIK